MSWATEEQKYTSAQKLVEMMEVIPGFPKAQWNPTAHVPYILALIEAPTLSVAREIVSELVNNCTAAPTVPDVRKLVREQAPVASWCGSCMEGWQFVEGGVRACDCRRRRSVA